VVIKLGPDGAYYRTQQDQGFVPGVPVTNVVDTVGAGDGFAVGMISALLENSSVPDAVQRANWIGSRAVQSRGDMEGLPTRAELSAGPEAANRERARSHRGSVSDTNAVTDANQMWERACSR
ncbi:carbohydrate kinase family protein, partial [Pseudomonas fluorescens]